MAMFYEAVYPRLENKCPCGWCRVTRWTSEEILDLLKTMKTINKSEQDNYYFWLGEESDKFIDGE